jgi:hypothetical protein
MTDSWWEYVQSVSGKARPADIAAKTGISAPTISRWNPASKGHPKCPEPENVVKFASSYEQSPFEALLHANYGISREDLDIPMNAPVSMDDLSDADFVEALADRLAALRAQLRRHDPEEGLASDDFIEDSGMDGMEDRNEG